MTCNWRGCWGRMKAETLARHIFTIGGAFRHKMPQKFLYISSCLMRKHPRAAREPKKMVDLRHQEFSQYPVNYLLRLRAAPRKFGNPHGTVRWHRRMCGRICEAHRLSGGQCSHYSFFPSI